jgi:DNA repair exonuclease SbcCD ATPase subunit
MKDLKHKNLTPRQTKKLYDSHKNLEKVYEIVFGYHGYLRNDFDELEKKLNELVESFVDERVENSDYRDIPNLEKDLKELERLRESYDYQEEDHEYLSEIYSIVYGDEDAIFDYDFESLRKKLKRHFPKKKSAKN